MWTTDRRLIPETRQDNYLLDHHQATLHRFLLFQDAVLHGLIIRQPYTDSFSFRCSFTLTHHQATLHRFSSFQDEVLHGLIIRQPYTGSFFQPTKLQLKKQSPDGIYNPILLSIISPNGICKPIPDITLLILHHASANFWAL